MVNLDDDKKLDDDTELGAGEDGEEDAEDVDSWELEEDLDE